MRIKFFLTMVLLLCSFLIVHSYSQNLTEREENILKFIINSLKIDTTTKKDANNNNNNFNDTNSLTEVNSFKIQNDLNQITTNIVTGTVLYLEGRVKEEMSTLMFEKFGKSLNKAEFKKFESLFPNLIKSVNTLGDNLFNYKLYLPTLQQAMQDDIKNIPVNMIYFLNSLNKCPNKKELFNEFVIASNNLLNGEPYLKVISDLEEKIKNAGMLNVDQFKLSKGINIYLSDSIEKRSFFIKQYFGSCKYTENKSDIMTQAYMNAINQLSMVKKEAQNSREYYIAVINLLRCIPNQNAELNDLIETFSDILNAFYDIRQNQFPMALIRTKNILERTDEYPDSNKYQNVIKTLLFIANIASAKNGEEIAGIINSTAMPAGSYRLKRKEGGYVFINSYVGLKYQREFYNDKSIPLSNSYGINGPIGVSVGIYKCFGIFASLIDLGQYLSYSKNDKVEDFPEVTLSNIFSPGIFLEWNIPGLFLTAAGGYSFGPWDRMNTAKNLELKAHGIQFNLKIDMPLYTLHRKQIF